MLKLVTFDLDGTIIDDEWAHEQAKIEIAKGLGATGDLSLSHFTGRSNRLFWENVYEAFQLPGKPDTEDLVARQFSRVFELVRDAGQPESKGLSETLRYLKSNGYTTALCSGSDLSFVDNILDYLNLQRLFDFKVTKNYVKNVKPAPDIYLAAQQISGIGPEFSAGIEDSYSGCLALRSAGMLSIGYTNQGKNTSQDLSIADHCIDEMTGMIPILEQML